MTLPNIEIRQFKSEVQPILRTMKNKHQSLASLMTATIAIALVNNIGFGSFDRVDAKPNPVPGSVRSAEEPAFREVYEMVKRSPTISGEVTFLDAEFYNEKWGKQCKDIKVNLVSEENLPKPPNDGVTIRLDVPIFKYSQSLSGDLKTGKCNYSIGASRQYIGKKARLTFSGLDDIGGYPSNPNVTVPSGAIKINFDNVGFGHVN
jgi:hypothetical protein